MRDKVDQLRGEIGDKTAWDSKYCSDLFNRRSEYTLTHTHTCIYMYTHFNVYAIITVSA